MKEYIFAVLLGSIGLAVHAAEPSFSEIQSLLEPYCYKCHDADVSKGDFRLDTYASLRDVIVDRKHRLKVLEQLETREMPTKKPLPSDADYAKMIRWIDRAINDIDWEKYRHPGHVTLPRLTNVEYDRTIRDLLGIDIGTSQIFSTDGEGKSEFTNDRDNLFLSSSQLEKYFTAGEWAIDTLAGLRASPEVQRFEAENMFMTESRTAISTFPDKSRGIVLNRGQMTLYESVAAPHRGIYEFRVRMSSSRNGRAGLLLRINDQLEGELESEGQSMEEVVLPVFLHPGNHQMAWNFKSYPVTGKPGQKGRKKPIRYAPPPP